MAAIRLAYDGVTPAISAPAAEKEWDGAERRGPDRARNVAHLAQGKAAAGRQGADTSKPAPRAKAVAGDWEEL